MTSNPTADNRRTRRKRANFTTEVFDTISGKTVGYLGDLSAGGLLLVGTQPPRKDALYQLKFPLHGFDHQPQQIEIGVQAQWHARGSSPDQVWAGFRIIAISQRDVSTLECWLNLPI